MIQQETPQWYVVYSKPHKETFAKFHLRLKGLEVFLPLLHLPRSLDRHKQIIPLFPNYLFVRICLLEEYYYALWSPGVKRFVSFNGVPAPLDERIVTFLMKQANPDGVITARSNLKAGQEVQVTSGPFEGLVGIIQEPPNARGRVKVLLNLLSREVKVELPVQVVKGSWVV